ncbi:MAG: T9SS type A sorting domain-containing protein, partial [Bacteroidota bacterium]|nr:T9SS type A sorting domain-containing protein [Bacteroidota bacterium]
ANITGIAAGMPAVLIRINWQNYFGIYYWIIDDFELVEAYDNDLRIQNIDIQWDDLDVGTEEGFSYMLPISQLIDGHGFHLLESTVINMGKNLQTDIKLTLNAVKNGQIEYTDEKSVSFLDTEWEETVLLDGKFIPNREFGKYEITFNWTQAEEESYPDDNLKTLSFLITDSVYSRADDTADYPFSYRYAEDEPGLNAIVDHFIGSKFPIYGDCEIDGVSVFLMGGLADGLIHFRYVAFVEVRDDETEEIIDRKLLLTSELVDLDSSMFNQWIYLPFDKDGESEFVSSKTVLYAGIQYSDYHPDKMTRRNQGLTIGADNSSPNHDPRSVGSYRTSSWDGSTYITERNLMVRLLINDHTDLSGRDNVLNSPFTLQQNYPNPFTEETNISYTLTQPSSIDIVIRDITGKTVMVINEGMKPPGEHSVSLKAMELGAGIYTYTIIAGDFQETKQMIISK